MDRAGLARRLGFSRGIAEAPAGAAVVEEREPAAFIAAFARAVGDGGAVFLADPAWGAAERAVLAELRNQASDIAVPGWHGNVRGPTPAPGWLMIPSGGSSGTVKFARHDEETLSAAVRGFCAHFAVQRANCVGVLPLHHVSGLMAWMRAALTGGEYRPWDWKRLEKGDFPVLPPGRQPGTAADGSRESARRDRWFLSLVPTQLQRLLPSPGAVEWLRRFDVVFLGGGPSWPDLAAAAARARLPISLSYGMTETAAMATALRPAEFLAGDRSCGAALPHARVELAEAGVVRVGGESLFRGYFPEWRREEAFTTEDLGTLDERGHLHVVGRRDAVIITGGRKVDPPEVEAALRASGEFTDVAVLGLPDPEWGETVVACYPSGQPAPDLTRVAERLEAIAGHKRPRRYVPVPDWPRNAQGKLNRAALRAALRPWPEFR